MAVEKNLITFATYVSFFPQLVAGPIVRAVDLIPQLNSPTHFEEKNVSSGLPLIFKGLFKKIIIADLLAAFGVDLIFEDPAAYSTLTLWLGLYGYAIQIYCDFSGYSDIAIGLARIMGFELCINFDRPYLSRNPQEFWRRWHISLSSWLRDYLYISLGGNRLRKIKTYRNIIITMLLGGLWHGAAWHFVIWGFYHGLLLIIARFWWPFATTKRKIGQMLGTFTTFNFICLGWLLFRAQDVPDILLFLKGLFSFKIIRIFCEFNQVFTYHRVG